MIVIGIDCMLACIVVVSKCIIMIRRSGNNSEWNARSCGIGGR